MMWILLVWNRQLKVACDRGEHQRIADVATQLTLSEKKFVNLMNRFKGEHHIIKVPCPELVRMVEEINLMMHIL